ncbi:DUF397 domain-containing protein [Streptomyces olivaceoviridis]
MLTPDTWQKSSFSGGGQGDACVEVRNRRTQTSIRDSESPTRATLTFPTSAFATFIEAVKATPSAGAVGCLPG